MSPRPEGLHYRYLILNGVKCVYFQIDNFQKSRFRSTSRSLKNRKSVFVRSYRPTDVIFCIISQYLPYLNTIRITIGHTYMDLYDLDPPLPISRPRGPTIEISTKTDRSRQTESNAHVFRPLSPKKSSSFFLKWPLSTWRPSRGPLDQRRSYFDSASSVYPTWKPSEWP